MSQQQDYDKAMSELEQLVAELENGTPVSMSDYAQKAHRALELAKFCTEQLRGFIADLKKSVQQD